MSVPSSGSSLTRVYEQYTTRQQHIGADGIADAVIIRTFDRERRPSSEDWQRPDAPHRTMTYHYDAGGQLDSEVVSLFRGKPVMITAYRYDRDGREIEKALDENPIDGKSSGVSLPAVTIAGTDGIGPNVGAAAG